MDTSDSPSATHTSLAMNQGSPLISTARSDREGVFQGFKVVVASKPQSRC